MSERKCPHCGAQAPDSDFITLCPACGRSLQADAPARAPQAPEDRASQKDAVCASCGAQNAPQTERCWQCRKPLSALVGAERPEPSRPSAGPQSLDLGRVFGDALKGRRPGEDFDEALLRAAKAASPDHWSEILGVALQLLNHAASAGEERDAAAARLARERIEVEISSSEQATRIDLGGGPGHDAGAVSALADLPPEVRREIEERLGPLPEHLEGSKTTVTRRVVVRQGDVPLDAAGRLRDPSLKIVIRGGAGQSKRSGCISFSALGGILLGCLGLRR